jgi:DNA invertase Pin-like site-specific DNA recombinase
MKGQNVGYVRVSSASQNVERQLQDVQLDKVFTDKVSGKNILDRPQLRACLNHLREGDVLHVHSIDRLARNLFNLQELVKELNSKGCSIIFHKEQLEFSANKEADSMKSSMQNLTLHLLGAFAEFERSLIKNRQAEGIANAKLKNTTFGAPKKIADDQRKELIILANDKNNSKKSLAAKFGISTALVYKILASQA